MTRLSLSAVSNSARPQPAKHFDPDFRELVEMCMRLAREKAALEERVEKLEAQLENYARDEQAREAAEREEAEFQMFALAGEVGERIRWPQN
jgi:hypothetical protein